MAVGLRLGLGLGLQDARPLWRANKHPITVRGGLCAAGVDDDVLDIGKAMEQVHQVANMVSIDHNPNDNALRVSDYTMANPDRLGQRGAARPQGPHKKLLQLDCSAFVTGLTQHSYYTNGRIARGLNRQAGAPNRWSFKWLTGVVLVSMHQLVRLEVAVKSAKTVTAGHGWTNRRCRLERP